MQRTHGYEPGEKVSLDSLSCELMRCIFDARKPSSTGQLVVLSSLLATMDARETLWVVCIVVMLMDDEDAGSRIHYGNF